MLKQDDILFIDRDGTLIIEPADKQVDSLEKLELIPMVIPALRNCVKAGYQLVMISNQDGLGTSSFPESDFLTVQNKMLDLFRTQGIEFADILVCPHFQTDRCECRKPKTGLLTPYLIEQRIRRDHSFVIGDRDSDIDLAKNLGISGIRFGSEEFPNWSSIENYLLYRDRVSTVSRKTNETDIQVTVNCDTSEPIKIDTGIGFFDHMLEQLARHGGFSLICQVKGDTHIDDHHTVEDTALAIGEALKSALHKKMGIARYGFVLPMDETQAQVALDLSGRPYCKVEANLTADHIGEFNTEMAPHFFQSLAQAMGATLHLQVNGVNNHHIIEAMFKSVGRCLRQAIARVDTSLPSTKGIL